MIRVCDECYSNQSRVTPLLKPLDCLRQHTQYICGSCGRCICIEKDPKRGLQRWHFPFQTIEAAKLYIRAAMWTVKSSCGIYEIEHQNGRIFYKIFAKEEDLLAYLKKHKDKRCKQKQPVIQASVYQEYPNAQVRKLTEEEIERYMADRDKLQF